MEHSFESQVRPGMDVFDVNDEKIGTVAETDEGYLRVPSGLLGMGGELAIPLTLIHDVAGEAIHLSVTKEQVEELGPQEPTETDGDFTDTTGEQTTAAASPATLQLREEQLTARAQSVETGRVQIGTAVVSEQQTLQVPVMHEEVTIERRPVDRRASDRPIEETNEIIEMPVHEEHVTLDKRTVVYEEVGLEKRQVHETQSVSGTVRREEAVVEEDGTIDRGDRLDRDGPRG